MRRIAIEPDTEDQLDLFYNTTGLTDAQVKKQKKKRKKQNERIYKFFFRHPKGYYTPFEVQMLAGMMYAPLTSVRRAINTLTRAGMIDKTTRKKPGGYGVPNYTWRLA